MEALTRGWTAVNASGVATAPRCFQQPSEGHKHAKRQGLHKSRPKIIQKNRINHLVAACPNAKDIEWLNHNSFEAITWLPTNPLEGITEELEKRKAGGSKTNELHIIAHGSNGAIKLGDTLLTKEHVEDSAHLLQAWELQSIHLWSCEAGQNTELIEILAKLTGADVYASRSEISREHPHLSSITEEEVSLEALIGKTTLRQWSGTLASTQVLDANYQQLVFEHTNYDTSFNNPNGSLTEGQVILFKDVITISGQAVDALYTLSSANANLRIDNIDDGGVNRDYISTDLYGLASGEKSITAEISFYEAGTYTGAGTGDRVTLENVVINTYDIDVHQYQVFQGFQSYEVANNTGLTITTQSDGSVKFDDAAGQGTSGTEDAGRARVYYDAIDTFEIQMGSDNERQIFFYLDFQLGPAWTGDTTTTDTPAANFTWSTRNLTEDAANVGSFTETVTITFDNPGTTIFAGSNGDTITHSATNVPAGLTTVVTRASDTTATITVTGNATNHTTSDDLSNIELEFENSAFVVGSVGASSITDARITNFGLSFIDDTTRPTIAITDDDADNSLSAGDTSTLTFTLSEAATDFVEADATVTGGSLSNWTAVSSTVYTATFTPTADSTTNGVIHVANDKFSDAASNTNQDESDANNTVTFTVDTTTSPTPSPSPSPSPSPAPSPTPTPTPESTSEKGDVYLLLDTSTSMLHSEGKDHSKFQCLLALETFSKDAERAGYQFQRRDTNSTITSTQLLQTLANQTSTQAIQELDNYTIIDNPNDAKNADDLDIHLITYDYHVQHNTFTLSRTNPSSGIDTMQSILSLKMAGQVHGNSIKNNSKWKELGLPDPNRFDLHKGRSDRPSNLYAGTELLGALEGLDYLLNNKANDTSRRDQSTKISLFLDGRPERRSWWDTRTNSASDSITGQAIPLPESLGKEDITTSGLLYDNEGNPHFFKNNQGEWQWKEMQNDLNAALDRLATYATDPTTIQVKAYGLNNTGSTSLNATYQDLFSNQSFDNSSSSWGYAHQTIHSLQGLNL